VIDVCGWDYEEQDGVAVIFRFFARNYLKFAKTSLPLPFTRFSIARSQSVCLNFSLIIINYYLINIF